MNWKDKLKRKLCSKFGHQWRYSKVSDTVGGINGQIDIRVCERCGLVQNWSNYISLIDGTKKLWVNSIQFTDLGAQHHIVGYGK
jgi:hypothetical protein